MRLSGGASERECDTQVEREGPHVVGEWTWCGSRAARSALSRGLVITPRGEFGVREEREAGLSLERKEATVSSGMRSCARAGARRGTGVVQGRTGPL